MIPMQLAGRRAQPVIVLSYTVSLCKDIKVYGLLAELKHRVFVYLKCRHFEQVIKLADTLEYVLVALKVYDYHGVENVCNVQVVEDKVGVVNNFDNNLINFLLCLTSII